MVRSVTVATCTPSLLTANPVTPSLSLILPEAGSLQVRVMEVVVRDERRRFCGGPEGTEREEEVMSGVLHFLMHLTQ